MKPVTKTGRRVGIADVAPFSRRAVFFSLFFSSEKHCSAMDRLIKHVHPDLEKNDQNTGPQMFARFADAFAFGDQTGMGESKKWSSVYPDDSDRFACIGFEAMKYVAAMFWGASERPT